MVRRRVVNWAGRREGTRGSAPGGAGGSGSPVGWFGRAFSWYGLVLDVGRGPGSVFLEAWRRHESPWLRPGVQAQADDGPPVERPWGWSDAWLTPGWWLEAKPAPMSPKSLPLRAGRDKMCQGRLSARTRSGSLGQGSPTRAHQAATCHAFRHPVATQLLTSGHDIRTIQQLLRHRNVATTAICTHVLNRGGRGSGAPRELWMRISET